MQAAYYVSKRNETLKTRLDESAGTRWSLYQVTKPDRQKQTTGTRLTDKELNLPTSQNSKESKPIFPIIFSPKRSVLLNFLARSRNPRRFHISNARLPPRELTPRNYVTSSISQARLLHNQSNVGSQIYSSAIPLHRRNCRFYEKYHLLQIKEQRQDRGTWRTPGLSIPWCCLPTSSSVCLVFFPLSLCLARARAGLNLARKLFDLLDS